MLLAAVVAGGLVVRARSLHAGAPSHGRVVSPDAAAEAWLQANVAHDRPRLIVDDSMGLDLTGAGWPSSSFVTFDGVGSAAPSDATSWRGFDFIVVPASELGAVLHGSAGEALTNSEPVARFGRGGDQVEVREIFPEGLATAARDLYLAVAQRGQAGTQLLDNPAVTARPAAAEQLRTGQVDSALMTVLAALALSHRFVIADFPVVAGETGSWAPRRVVELSAVDGSDVRPTARASVAGPVDQALGFLAAQRPPFAPTQVAVVATTSTSGAVRVTLPFSPASRDELPPN